MIRRIPKPFTVEIRNGRRKPLSALAIEQDQPHVEWPSAMLDELRAPAEVAEPVVTPPVPDRPTRRILPAIDPPVRPVAPPPVTDAERDEEVLDLAEPQTAFDWDEDEALPAPVPDARTVDVPAPERPGRARRPRAEFSRGERWKARLPASVHRTRGKPRGT